jgi:hypothetical protein
VRRAARRVALLALLGCSDARPPARAAAPRLAGRTCEALLPAAAVEKVLGHAIRYQEVRQDAGPVEAISCENRTARATEVFAFDVGCGVGARVRFRDKARALRRAIRQTEPKVGDEAWASENVYLSWFAARNCFSTVLISWRRPHPDRLRGLAEALSAALPSEETR